MDIAAEFRKFCGPSVLYVSHAIQTRTLRVYYKIPAVDDAQQSVGAHLRNNINSTILKVARMCAASARDHAYHATGQRSADIEQLLSRKTVPDRA